LSSRALVPALNTGRIAASATTAGDYSADASTVENTMTQTTGGLICPACRVDLVMSERQGVEIDYCPKCRGVWLDRGELDKILRSS